MAIASVSLSNVAEMVVLLVKVTMTAIGSAMTARRRPAVPAREADAVSLDDPLTGVGNRDALFLSGLALLQPPGAQPASLLLIDLDDLDALDEAHGPETGDRLLVALARVAHDYLPPTSLVCRIGDGRFAAILPATDLARARSVGDELRALFAHVAVAGPDGPVRGTFSGGVVASTADIAAALARAERQLAAARSAGGNRVTAEPVRQPPGGAPPVAVGERSFA